MGAIQGADGRIYVIGGDGGGDIVEAYDPVANTWACSTNDTDVNHHCASKTIKPAPTSRTDVSQYGIGSDGGIYVVGGYADYLEVYRPSSNTWSCSTTDPDPSHRCSSKTLTPMPHARGDMGVTTYLGKIYVFGGFGPSLNTSYFEVYNPSTNTWTCSIIDFPDARCSSYTLASMPHIHGDTRVTVSGSRIYVVGGYVNPPGTPSNQVDVYNPGANMWSSLPNTPTPRGDFGLDTSVDGNLYAFGGSGYASPGDALIHHQSTLDYVEAFGLLPSNSVCGGIICPLVDVHFTDQITGVSSKQHFQTYSSGIITGVISWRDGRANGLILPSCNTTLTLCRVFVDSFACTGGGGAQVYGRWAYNGVIHSFTLTVQDNDILTGGVETEGTDTVKFQTTNLASNPYTYSETGYSIVDVSCP